MTWPTRLKRFLIGLQITWDVLLVVPHYHEMTEMLRGWL